MLNLPPLEFKPLETSGENYLKWAYDASLYLDSEGLGKTIQDGNNASDQDKNKVMMILMDHLSEALQHLSICLEINDPLVLWNTLKERYEHVQKTIMLIDARHEWEHLRVEDFKAVWEYNSAIYRIRSQLELSGGVILTEEDMLEKTYSTLRTCNVHLKNVCRERLCKTYSRFIVFLVLAEKNNEIVLNNHESCPCGSSVFLDEKDICHFPDGEGYLYHDYRYGNGYNSGRGYNQDHSYRYGHGCTRGRGYNHGRGRGRGQGNWNHCGTSKNFYSHLKCNKNNAKVKSNKRWA